MHNRVRWWPNTLSGLPCMQKGWVCPSSKHEHIQYTPAGQQLTLSAALILASTSCSVTVWEEDAPLQQQQEHLLLTALFSTRATSVLLMLTSQSKGIIGIQQTNTLTSSLYHHSS